jgi:hypothetical protein
MPSQTVGLLPFIPHELMEWGLSSSLNYAGFFMELLTTWWLACSRINDPKRNEMEPLSLQDYLESDI